MGPWFWEECSWIVEVESDGHKCGSAETNAERLVSRSSECLCRFFVATCSRLQNLKFFEGNFQLNWGFCGVVSLVDGLSVQFIDAEKFEECICDSRHL